MLNIDIVLPVAFLHVQFVVFHVRQNNQDTVIKMTIKRYEDKNLKSMIKRKVKSLSITCRILDF